VLVGHRREQGVTSPNVRLSVCKVFFKSVTHLCTVPRASTMSSLTGAHPHDKKSR
jgi:hypothetical protein